jgi:hypothetical protein
VEGFFFGTLSSHTKYVITSTYSCLTPEQGANQFYNLGRVDMIFLLINSFQEYLPLGVACRGMMDLVAVKVLPKLQFPEYSPIFQHLTGKCSLRLSPAKETDNK